MNTIEKKVEAAMRATSLSYGYYQVWLEKWIKMSPSFAIKCRTLAVVNHDRYLTGRMK